MLIKGFELVPTCNACPEQYDVLKDNKIVGYLRLRHGYFSASYPDVGGETVYDAHPKGDGIFDEDERDKYLTLAITAIENKMNGNNLTILCPFFSDNIINDCVLKFQKNCTTKSPCLLSRQLPD